MFEGLSVTKERPHIIVILADDLGWNEVSELYPDGRESDLPAGLLEQQPDQDTKPPGQCSVRIHNYNGE